MKCPRDRSELTDLALGGPREGALSVHLDECEACRARLEDERQLLARIDGELRTALDVRPSPALLSGVRERIAQPRRAPLWRWMVPAMAAAMVAAVLFPTGVPPGPPPPPRVAVPPPPPPAVAATRAAPAAAPAAPSAPTTRAARARPRPPSAPEVFVPPQETERVRDLVVRLARGWRDVGPVRMGGDNGGARPIQVSPIEVLPVSNPRLEVEPIRIASDGVLPLTMDSHEE